MPLRKIGGMRVGIVYRKRRRQLAEKLLEAIRRRKGRLANPDTRKTQFPVSLLTDG